MRKFGLTGATLAACVAISILGIAAGATAATRGLTKRAAPSVELVAQLSGKGIRGGDAHGRGTVWLQVERSRRQVCFDMRISGAPKGRLLVGRAGHGEVLTLLGSKRPRAGSKRCVTKVATRLIRALDTHPTGFFVKLAARGFLNGAIRGQLTRNTGSRPNSRGLSDCNLYLYDDTGKDVVNIGKNPTPPNGTGVRSEWHNSGGDILGGFCRISFKYDYKDPNVTRSLDVLIENPVYGSNTYYCRAQGDIKCFGPRSGSTTSGWTLTAIYYICIPGAWPQNPSYCKG